MLLSVSSRNATPPTPISHPHPPPPTPHTTPIRSARYDPGEKLQYLSASLYYVWSSNMHKVLQFQNGCFLCCVLKHRPAAAGHVLNKCLAVSVCSPNPRVSVSNMCHLPHRHVSWGFCCYFWCGVFVYLHFLFLFVAGVCVCVCVCWG